MIFFTRSRLQALGRNRLKADIVGALQGLKCMMKRNLLFRRSALVDDADDYENDDSGAVEGEAKREG